MQTTNSPKSMQENSMKGCETMDYRRVILVAAPDCFKNHRGEEFTIQQLADKYNSSKDKSDEKK